MSIIDFSSKILIFDTGSTDKTIPIVRSIKSKKIHLVEKNNVSAKDLVVLRQQQVDETTTKWFWVVDGDEIYPKRTANEVIEKATSTTEYEGGIVRRFDLLGDIYHMQSENVGSYMMFGERGHFVLRLLNKKLLQRIRCDGVYPLEGYYDKNGDPIISHDKTKFFITQNKLFHAMYLKRSSLGANLSKTHHRKKFKVELGYLLPKNQPPPEVFFRSHPDNVESVLAVRSKVYKYYATFLTPIKNLKRLLVG